MVHAMHGKGDAGAAAVLLSFGVESADMDG